MIVDALQCGNFDRAVFEALLSGGAGCVTVTCGFYEGPLETMDIIGKMLDLVRENSDIVEVARTADDVRRISDSGRLAVVLGSQNSDCLGNRINFVELFAAMGLRVMQLTYNIQNPLATGCYEPNDSGLTTFGREVIAEMNRVGILLDLSHVGSRSTLDAIKASSMPVAVTHASADSVYKHKRNKSDEILHALRDTGGVIGCPTYRHIIGDEVCKSIENWGNMVGRIVDIIGIDHVGIGTDLSHNVTEEGYLWMYKGYHTRFIQFGAPKVPSLKPAEPPAFLKGPGEIGILKEGLRLTGFNDEEVEKIASGNWLRVYGQTFMPS